MDGTGGGPTRGHLGVKYSRLYSQHPHFRRSPVVISRKKFSVKNQFIKSYRFTTLTSLFPIARPRAMIRRGLASGAVRPRIQPYSFSPSLTGFSPFSLSFPRRDFASRASFLLILRLISFFPRDAVTCKAVSLCARANACLFSVTPITSLSMTNARVFLRKLACARAVRATYARRGNPNQASSMRTHPWPYEPCK